jgi:hypothetical protein
MHVQEGGGASTVLTALQSLWCKIYPFIYVIMHVQRGGGDSGVGPPLPRRNGRPAAQVSSMPVTHLLRFDAVPDAACFRGLCDDVVCMP